MDNLLSIISNTCPTSLGWGCMFWPIFFPAIIAVVILVVWWLLAGAKVKSDADNKDYSLIFIVGSIIVIAILGFAIYWFNKLPQ